MLENASFLSEKNKKIYHNIQGIIGLVLLSYYFVSKILERFSFNVLVPYFDWRIFLMLSLVYIVLCCRFSVKSAILSVAVFLIALGTREKYNYCGILFILICSTVDLRKFEKIAFGILSSFISVSTILSKIGIIVSNDRTVIDLRGYRPEWEGLYRHSLGMVHPNTAGLLVAEAILLLFMIFWNNLKWWHWVIAAGGIFLVGKYIDSRAALILLVISLVLMIFMKIFPRIFTCKPVKIILSLSPVLLMIFSFGIAFLYGTGNSIILKINEMSTGRVWISNCAIKTTDITLFGRYEGMYLDNMYVWSVYVHGILFAILLVSLYSLTLFKLFKYKEYPYIAIGIGYVCFSFFENLASNPIYNPFWWCAGAVLLFKAVQPREMVELKNNSKVK